VNEDASVGSGGRDEEQIAVLSAEAARGHVLRRNRDRPLEAPGRVVAPHGRASVDRTPHAAFIVHGQPVRPVGVRLDCRESTPILERPGADVVVEHVDRIRRRVDVIHAGPVRRPAEPIRERHVRHHGCERPVESVQRPAPRLELALEAADPEAAGGIAGAVVQPQVRAVRQHSERFARLVRQIEHGQAVGQRDKQSTVGHGRDRARLIVELDCPVAAGRELDHVHAATVDVDPEQRLAYGIPARSLTELCPRRDQHVYAHPVKLA